MTPGLRDVFAFSWRHWRRRPVTLAILGVGIGGHVLAEIAGPIFIGKLIDALSATDYQAAVYALGMILAMRFLFVVLHSGGDYAWTFLAVRILREICADAFSRVQKYSAEWHANTFAGSTVRKITRGFWAFDHLGDSFLLPPDSVGGRGPGRLGRHDLPLAGNGGLVRARLRPLLLGQHPSDHGLFRAQKA